MLHLGIWGGVGSNFSVKTELSKQEQELQAATMVTGVDRKGCFPHTAQRHGTLQTASRVLAGARGTPSSTMQK
jgi:hypothetical protein